jgi:mRNA interferase RelE/StbE
MSMELVYGRQAAKMLGRIQPKVGSAIRNQLEAIAKDPFARHANVKALEGVKGGFRLRHGDWRVLYRLDREQQKMFVELVKSRGDAYK